MSNPGRRSPGLLPVFLLLALGVMAAWSPAGNHDKKPYALIFGTVYTPSNRAAYGVKVKIRRADQKKPKWELISDRRGEFAQRVPAGAADYILWAEHGGKRRSPEVTVHVENDERVDVGLHLTE